jgi:hypothetical protein
MRLIYWIQPCGSETGTTWSSFHQLPFFVFVTSPKDEYSIFLSLKLGQHKEILKVSKWKMGNYKKKFIYYDGYSGANT